MANGSRAEVFLINTTDRAAGVKNLLSRFDLTDFSGKSVALKANYNSADPFPASTHIETLHAIVENLKKANAAEITLGERSGMGDTRQVLDYMGVLALANRVGFNVIVLDELDRDAWVKIEKKGTHWLRGFYIAKLFTTAEKIVQTCCLKAHRFGGHFTLSLKNSVGLVAKKMPGSLYDYMWELHGSPYQRSMIAEINKAYHPDFVIMDGIKAFVDGGPEQGKTVQPNLMLASKDRVAIDAVGIAVLRKYGSTKRIMEGPIFKLDQIRRASELKIGAKSTKQILVTPISDNSRAIANELTGILEREG